MLALRPPPNVVTVSKGGSVLSRLLMAVRTVLRLSFNSTAMVDAAGTVTASPRSATSCSSRFRRSAGDRGPLRPLRQPTCRPETRSPPMPTPTATASGTSRTPRTLRAWTSAGARCARPAMERVRARTGPSGWGSASACWCSGGAAGGSGAVGGDRSRGPGKTPRYPAYDRSHKARFGLLKSKTNINI